MKFLITSKDLLRKRKFIFLILSLLLFIQLIYGFISPNVGDTGTGHGWLTFQDLIRHQKSPLDVSDASIIDKFSPLFSKYRVNADGAVYLILAKNFPEYYFENNIFLSRPLYSFLVAVVAFFPRLFFDSYATFFVSAIFLNFILALLTAVMFYILVEKIISPRVALFSALLYILSLIVRSGMIQPMPDTLSSFMMVSGLYLLYNYVKNPSNLKLIVFSLITGLFLLGKLFPLMSFFILMLAVYFKRYKEGALFFVIHLMPLVLWYLWVTQVFKLEFFENSVQNFGAVTWMFGIFSWPWQRTARIFLDIFPKFISALVYGFLLIPLIFAAIGFDKLPLKEKKVIYFSFIFSFLIVFFVTNFYYPAHALLMFPLVYPLTVLGIDRAADFLKRYKPWCSTLFYCAIIVFFLIISGVNVYNLVGY